MTRRFLLPPPLWGRVGVGGRTCWPAASTIGDILKRASLIAPTKRRRRPLDQPRAVTAATAANDEWAVDIKGWFRTGDNCRIDPLTLTDGHSRFLLEVRIVPQTIEGSQPVFAAAFRRYGLQDAIRCDNGSPFGSTGAGCLKGCRGGGSSSASRHTHPPASRRRTAPRAHAWHLKAQTSRPRRRCGGAAGAL